MATFLAARTDEEPEAWEGRDPIGWSRELELDLDPEALRDLAQVNQELDRKRWAEDDGMLDPARLERVAGALMAGGL